MSARTAPLHFDSSFNSDDLSENVVSTTSVIVVDSSDNELSSLDNQGTTEETFRDKKKYIAFLENKLDTNLGFYFWKKYVASAFWAQVSMPINLAITLLTALTTAQATSSNLLPENVYVNISIATLLITVLNTFFSPHTQLNKNIELMKKWDEIGSQFEEVYYSHDKYDDVEKAIISYKEVKKEMNHLRQSEGPDTTNFLTDLIHIGATLSCLRNRQKWLDGDKLILAKNASCCSTNGCNNKSIGGCIA
jgi:hypothetical protein